MNEKSPVSIEEVARAIWRETYRHDTLMEWHEIKRGTLHHERTIAAAHAAARLSAPLCEEGWQVVPKEPTEEMVFAGATQCGNVRDTWAAMLAAAPTVPAAPVEEGGICPTCLNTGLARPYLRCPCGRIPATEPIAWRVKDFADGWIYCPSKVFADALSKAQSDAYIEALYREPPAAQAEIEQLRSDVAQWTCNSRENKLIAEENSRRADRAEARGDEVAKALEMLVEEKVDYMRINNLGNPEEQHTIKVARKALAQDGSATFAFPVGSKVEKIGGKYTGPGIVHVATRLDGDELYLVAHKIDGGSGRFLHVYSAKNLRSAT